ncbi:flagellar basal-body MS-ring/collar protein FliF [Rhodobium gokarnense]|uniref:Flagellar M-ring protein n=1 Tax=Rhodobium gokarnense TaxID=364296 RepID=A0ABT3H5M2_9HYPH|nr:flagellar basal-body MS-ring/collar protein FliF [Rhodobium gokarnense]MCW2305695.1 flagellar M-ring protein FliF [Rhodobium gokarnense]
MNGVVDFLKALGPARLGAMGAVAAILVGFFAIVMTRLSTPQMVPLYTDLSFADTTAIVRQLEATAVEYELRNDGAVVLVPEGTQLQVRMRLAEQGLPSGGNIGYEIFDKTDTLGTTSFVQSINHLRALEGELARTIKSINRISAARVHLVLPERQLFQRDKEEPSASIVVRVRGTLDRSHIAAIQHLVATAVEGLKPSNVSIVDETGRLLASGTEEDAQGLLATHLQERTVAYERRLRERIEGIVSEIVGSGRARVQVAAELDFNRITQTEQKFDPEGQVVRSSQSREENSTVRNEQKGVTAGNQIPNADQNANGDDNLPREASSTSEEITNYEISKTERTEVVEAGRIKRISVAVLVDGIYTPQEGGTLDYAPRSADDLERIAALVRSAVGFDDERGDQVEVVNLRFASAPSQLPLDGAEEGLFDFTKRDIFYFSELGVIVLLSLLTLLFIVRPLVRKIVEPEKEEVEVLTGPNGEVLQLNADGTPALPAPQEEENFADWFNDAQAEGENHANSIERVGGLIENYPNEAVSIVRTWLNEAPA